MTEEEPKYIPGVCNIGKAELIKRKNFAIMMGILAVVAAMGMYFLQIDRLFRLVLVLPFSLFAIGIQQWYFKFCANFGLRGIINFGELGKNIPVEMIDFAKADRNKAIKILVLGSLIGIVITVLFYFI